MKKQIRIEDVVEFLDGNNPDYYSWDKGECSLVGIIRVLLIQEVRKARKDPYEDRWEEMLSFLEENKER